jgi:rhodanese-related sulfurtransferase
MMDFAKVKSDLDEKKITLIDVRSEKERKDLGAIPGANHLHREFK